MAAKLTAAQLTELGAFTALEEQIVYIAQQLDAAQTAFNAANPQFARRAIEINADFINNSVAIQMALPLESSNFSAASVAEAFPAAAPAPGQTA